MGRKGIFGGTFKTLSSVLVIFGLVALLNYRKIYVKRYPNNPDETEQKGSGSDNGLTLIVPGERSNLHSSLLDDRQVVPNNVFYVWCGAGRHFEFRHYLSVLSVIHFLKPDNVDFFYDVDPVVDQYHYYTWLGDVADKYPFFRKQHTTDACVQNSSFVKDRLSRDGGIFVHESVVFARFDGSLRKSASVVAVGGKDDPVVKMSAAKLLIEQLPSGTNVTDEMAFRCVASSAYASAPGSDVSPLCVLLDQTIYPKDIWELDNPLGRLLRTVAYARPDLARPEPNYDELIPNIGHVVWIGGGEMKFDFYLSVVSLLHVAKVDAVYVHGQAPTGFYWDLVKTDPRVKVIYRTLDHVYGNGKPVGHKEHISDICRVDVLLRYGGIYIDTDALFVRPLTREIRGYDAVASKDINTAVYTLYPDNVSNGVLIGKPNARFWKLFLESMKTYDEKDYFSIGVRQPYKIKERHPDTVLLEPHLQVLCFQSKCRPTWTPDYQKESVNQLTTDVLRNWKNDTFVFHMTWPTPQEFESHGALLGSKTMIGDIGRHVLEQAGMLTYFQKLVENAGIQKRYPGAKVLNKRP